MAVCLHRGRLGVYSEDPLQYIPRQVGGPMTSTAREDQVIGPTLTFLIRWGFSSACRMDSAGSSCKSPQRARAPRAEPTDVLAGSCLLGKSDSVDQRPCGGAWTQG